MSKTVKDLVPAFQAELITNLEKENKQLKQQLETLKLQLTPEALSAEELICVEQINILQNRSSQRELSLEEIKKLDLLVKNLRLIKEPLKDGALKDVTGKFSEADLVAIASQPES